MSEEFQTTVVDAVNKAEVTGFMQVLDGTDSEPSVIVMPPEEVPEIESDYSFRPLLYPNPGLNTVCLPVEEITDEVREFCLHLQMLMHTYQGAGLAAPQLGRFQRILAMEYRDFEKQELVPMIFINPEMVEHSPEALKTQEACLSLPKIHINTKRWKNLVMKAKNMNGDDVQMELTEINAVIFQHELDHLDGITIIDRVGRVQKELVLRQYNKIKVQANKVYDALSLKFKPGKK